MKKHLIFTLVALIISVYTFADVNTHSAINGSSQETYYLAEYKEKLAEPITTGVLIRFGYAFN